ncbi:hypothetical protein BDK92_7231 [Micromonospora pisi]|uniref:AlpA family transcriptional regulator n=1 Tax=Micromonospora pisi TaxID=589240 RepID=A0A495JWM1_9ACTN|nr:hypothetical protein [Micromonospora pisi]RKR92752.1 hypothetical protein BDK92_7231 [Micromonospora pisi]
MGSPPAYWDLSDLAATGDLASEFEVNNATISNWAARYPDFPRPLATLSTGPVWSRWMVRQWHDSRDWQPGRPRKQTLPEPD